MRDRAARHTVVAPREVESNVDRQLGLCHSGRHHELDWQRDGSQSHEIIRVDRLSVCALAEPEPLRARFGNDSLEWCPAESDTAARGRARPLSKTQAWLLPEDCRFGGASDDG